MNYYPRYPADYAAKTLHLSMAEDGAYTRMLDWMYSNSHQILHKNRYRIARANGATERKIVDKILNEFFTLEDDAWTHSRVTKEIANAAPKIAAARQNGRKGGRPPKNPVGFNEAHEEKPSGFPEKNPVGFDNHNPVGFQEKSSPEPELEEKKKQDQKPCAASAARFADFWAAYPRHEAKKQAVEVWQRKRLDERADSLIADVERRKREHRPWLDGFVPHAVVFLRNERWEDAIDHGQRDARRDEPNYLAGAV